MPISEPYWAQVRITEAAPGGPQAVTHWVLIQAFERRVLTYIPDYSPPWDVQMGNIGSHYVTWRYPDGLPGQAVVYNAASAGVVCRGRAPAGAPCDRADPVGPPPTAAYYDDTLRADAAGTLNAATLAAKFRLLPGAAIRLKNAADLNPVERFFLESGQALFDHRNGAGEIEIDSGNTSIRPIDTQFTVTRDAAGELKLAVIVGDGGVEVRSPTGVTTITAGSQVRVGPAGVAEFAEPLDAISQRAWTTFAAQNDVSSPVAGFDLTQCGAASSAFLPPEGDKRLGCAAGDAAFLGPDAPGQVVLFGGGLLLFDPLDQSPTVYALYNRNAAEGGRTWEAFALTDSDPTAFRELHPTAAQRLGARQQTCPTAPWAIQPFAGGAAIALPDTSTCATISHDRRGALSRRHLGAVRRTGVAVRRTRALALIALAGTLLLAACGGEIATPTLVPTAAPGATAVSAPVASVFDATGGGGVICHAAGGTAPCDPATPPATAGADDTVKTAADGTVGLSTSSVKLRLLQSAEVRLKSSADLGLGDRFLLQAGEVLFDHENSTGEVVIEAGNLRVQPIDTKFCVIAEPDGGFKVGVFGEGTVVVTNTAGSGVGPSATMLTSNQEYDLPAGATTPQIQHLTPSLHDLWTRFGVLAPEPADTAAPTATPLPPGYTTATPGGALPARTGLPALINATRLPVLPGQQPPTATPTYVPIPIK